MSVKEKATAPVSSVGADGKQPLCKANKESIADLGKLVRCMMDHCRNTRLMRLELWFCVRLVISIWGC